MAARAYSISVRQSRSSIWHIDEMTSAVTHTVLLYTRNNVMKSMTEYFLA